MLAPLFTLLASSALVAALPTGQQVLQAGDRAFLNQLSAYEGKVDGQCPPLLSSPARPHRYV